ncbi:hypothetical protein [Streptomyces sp. NPDC051173]|uniref:hypothetical protein n=1 Tax=Streptomyces sp. NPDC051173 TaxID=3155164 RepID=UPI0034504C9A
MRLGITGHRGLPIEVERRVRAALVDVVKAFAPVDLVGASCIADGPDAWFAQAVLDHGGRVEVIVPAEEYRAGLPEWHHETYDELLRRASEVHHTGFTESNSQAVRKVWPEVEVICASASLEFDDYVKTIGDEKLVVDQLVGDLQRVIEYPKLGFAIEQDVPEDVHAAYRSLLEDGFDSRLLHL